MPPTDSLVKNRNLQSWSIFTTLLELTLSKIRDQWKPSRRRSLTLATPKKSFVCFLICARRIFLLNENKTFLWCSALNEQAAGAASIFYTARKQKISLPLKPPSTFCLLAERLTRRRKSKRKSPRPISVEINRGRLGTNLLFCGQSVYQIDIE